MESILFCIFGGIVGFLSGFFGIGGGGVVVPVMMLFGFDIKFAIGISIIQMVFSSVYGSYINFKNKMFDPKTAFILGFGGLVGASFSGFIVETLSSKTLLFMLGFLQIFNIIKLFLSEPTPKGKTNDSKIILFILGVFTGAFAISVGIGGSILIMPILIGFLNYDIKKAVSTGLFFVIFSSISGFISLSMKGFVNYELGILIGIGSLFGVRFGVKLAKSIDRKKQKIALICLCVAMFLITLKKIFLG